MMNKRGMNNIWPNQVANLPDIVWYTGDVVEVLNDLGDLGVLKVQLKSLVEQEKELQQDQRVMVVRNANMQSEHIYVDAFRIVDFEKTDDPLLAILTLAKVFDASPVGENNGVGRQLNLNERVQVIPLPEATKAVASGIFLSITPVNKFPIDDPIRAGDIKLKTAKEPQSWDLNGDSIFGAEEGTALARLIAQDIAFEKRLGVDQLTERLSGFEVTAADYVAAGQGYSSNTAFFTMRNDPMWVSNGGGKLYIDLPESTFSALGLIYDNASDEFDRLSLEASLLSARAILQRQNPGQWLDERDKKGRRQVEEVEDTALYMSLIGNDGDLLLKRAQLTKVLVTLRGSAKSIRLVVSPVVPVDPGMLFILRNRRVRLDCGGILMEHFYPNQQIAEDKDKDE